MIPPSISQDKSNLQTDTCDIPPEKNYTPLLQTLGSGLTLSSKQNSVFIAVCFPVELQPTYGDP